MSESDTCGDVSEHIWVARLPDGQFGWHEDFDVILEWAGGLSECITIMHKRGHEYVLDLSLNYPFECCMNHRYECGHIAFGPPRRLPSDCPGCDIYDTDSDQ